MSNSRAAGIFPGQGSQSAGMGRELAAQFAAVRETFAEADRVLGFPISSICFEGPAEELTRTSIAQPALVTMSTAYWRLLGGRPDYIGVVAGHSLGEYSALVAAGALTFADALCLVGRRGELMEQAGIAHPGGMAAIIGLEDDAVEKLCQQASAAHGVVVVANLNSPGQVVISGAAGAVAAARALAREQGGKAIPLQVSGAFHSPLMQEAAESFAEALAETEIRQPWAPVVPNVTALPTSDPAAIRDALARQITSPVRWVQSLYAMRDLGVQRFIEIGPGTVLAGLVRRTLPEATAVSVSEALAE